MICVALLVVLAFTFYGSKREKDVKGKVVLITGGASGIGLGMARAFAALGSKVVVWDINPKGLEEVEKELKGKKQAQSVHTYICDVSERENIYKVAEQVKQEVGKVDILINNAGIVVGKPFLDTPDALTEKVMRINTMAVMWTVKAFLPDMIKSSGHLVTISSAAGTTGNANLVDYCASKYAACGFMDALRVEIMRKDITNVKFTTVMPYYINTGMFAGVKSTLLFPILDPEYVVKSIVHGVRTDEVELFLPITIKLRFFMRLFPVGASDFVGKLLGINKTMDEFVGRK